MKKVYTIPTVICFLVWTGHAGECVYTDPAWQALKPARQKALIVTPSFAPGDETCFIAFLNRINQVNDKKISTVQIVTHLKNYSSSSHTFSAAMLHAALSLNILKKQPRHATTVISLWESFNGPLRSYCNKLEERGLFNEADTLYTDAYAASLLDEYDMLKWTRIKGVLGRYDDAAALYCAISRKQRDFETIARNEFVQLLTETQSPKIQQKALETYRDCYLAKSDADTLVFSQWESSIASRFGLFALEDAAIQLDKRTQSRGLRFLDAAQYRFARKQYAAAIPAARQSWPDLTTGLAKQASALVLYQSYHAIGKKDSALMWLEKTAVASSAGVIETAVLYQRTGHFAKADSVIKKMSVSRAKDTLTIRQYLFTHDTASACSFTIRRIRTATWEHARPDALFWLLRTVVFSGRLQDVADILDSINTVVYPLSWPYTADLLRYQVAAQQYAEYPDAFIAWGNIQYALFCDHPEKAVAGFSCHRWSEPINELLGASLVEALVQKEQYDSAQQVLASFSEPCATARLAYLRGVVNDRQGFHEKARSLFEQTILAYPDDVFAHKARIYLLKLEENNRL